MKKFLFIISILLVMIGFNSKNSFAQGLGGDIASLLMEAGGGGRVAANPGIVTGTWSSPYVDADMATDGDYSTFAYGSVTGDGTGNNIECSVRWDMGNVFDISIITVKADITGTPHGNMFIRVSQNGTFWTQLPGYQLGISSNALQKEATILCPYRIQHIEVVSQTSYSDPSNIKLYEIAVR